MVTDDQPKHAQTHHTQTLDPQAGHARQWFYNALHKVGGEHWHVITPNQRLALFLGRDWAREESRRKPVWQPLQAQPWQQWIGQLWQSWTLQQGLEGITAPTLLNADEIKACWDTIAGAQHADQALEADRLAREWRLPLEPINCNDHQQVAVQWQAKYAALKQHKAWCDPTDVLFQITSQPQAFAAFMAQPLLFYGFVEYSPLQRLCLEVLESAGVVCHRGLELGQPQQAPRLQQAVDTLDDIYGAAQWARARWQALALERDFQQDDFFDGPRIAVVVPDLAQQQARIKSVFSEVFQWQEMLEKPVHWTISAGMAFSDYPVIQTLLDLLDLCFGRVSLAVLERVFRSPWWGHEAFAELAPQVFEPLRNSGREHWTLADLRFWLAGFFMDLQRQGRSMESCQESVSKTLDQLYQIFQAEPYARMTWHDWLAHFLTALEAADWPGSQLLQSDDFQVLQRWHAWWLAQQQHSPELIGFEEARSRLGRAWRELMFQPEAATDRILVLGLLEAAALPLDEVYILGLTASNWPAPSQPNPFLPYEEQRALGLPRASTQREVWYGEALLKWYHSSTQSLQIGFAKTHEDVPQFLSPLVTQVFGALPVSEVQSAPWHSRLTVAYHTPMDTFSPMQEQVRLRSGTKGLAEQGICPFRGGLALRIRPGQEVMPKTSVTGLDRGQWLHDVFEVLWQQGRDSTGLSEITDAHLNQWVCERLNKAAKFLPLLTPITQEVERQRLLSLLRQGLALEKERGPFQVQGIEEKVLLEFQGQFQGMSMELRLDRWDTQEDCLVLIDYKTRVPKKSEDRMVAPQLILYVLALAQKLRLSPLQMDQHLQEAVYFVLNPKDGAKWVDMIASQESSDDANAVASWLAQELNLLEQVCTEVRTGDARLDPLEGDKTCRECDFQSFCRVRERALASNQSMVEESSL